MRDKTDYKIAYLGRPGSYCYLAALKYFPATPKMVACKNILSVFQYINQNNDTYGVVPVENSSSGSILETFDHLIKFNLKISGEILLSIHHNILVKKETKNIKEITACLSHEHAIRQCHKFLGKYRKWKIELCDDTATAARLVSQKKGNFLAAISSKNCAQIYALKIIKRNIEDNSLNSTRFLVVTNAQKKSGNKVSIVYRLAHRPGSLVESLRPISEAGFNLTKIESRPFPGRPWEYLFYVDFESEREITDLEKINGKLKKAVNYLKILGIYDKGKKYEA